MNFPNPQKIREEMLREKLCITKQRIRFLNDLVDELEDDKNDLINQLEILIVEQFNQIKD